MSNCASKDESTTFHSVINLNTNLYECVTMMVTPRGLIYDCQCKEVLAWRYVIWIALDGILFRIRVKEMHSQGSGEYWFLCKNADDLF